MGAYHPPLTAVQIQVTLSPGVVVRHRKTSYFMHLIANPITFFVEVTIN
jgi:hypothetical protein